MDTNYYWDTKIDFLKKSRELYFNDEYFDYLVNYVWKIDKPITLLDFGCGIGYLGTKLMPLFPKGSRYIGIDKGKKLLEECKKIFSQLPYESEFHYEDITDMDTSKYQGDITICQTVLQHMSSPKDILKTMRQCTKKDGLVVAINPMWISSMANFYVHEVDPLETTDLGILQKLYEYYAANGETNGQLGIRTPVLMSEIGLKDVGCRMNDKINYIHPQLDKAQHDKLYDALMSEGYGAPPNEVESSVARLSTKGITKEEAIKIVHMENTLNKTIKDNRGNLHILWALSFVVSFGRK